MLASQKINQLGKELLLDRLQVGISFKDMRQGGFKQLENKPMIWQQAIGFCAFAVLSLLGAPSGADIVTDGTVGPAQNLLGQHFRIGAELGTTRGTNLFHSFRIFNIRNDESATFTGPNNIANVISRVTGGEASTIDGLLRSQVGQADFFFINPAGVIFGPNAQVDVPAAFHVGTADELRLEDGAVFNAVDPAASTLSMAQPESFGFLSPQPASISVNGSQLEFAPNSRASVSAGNVTTEGGASLVTDGGDIQITAVGESGKVVSLAAEPADLVGNGVVSITESSTIDVSGTEGSETVALRGGLVEIADSVIAADHQGRVDSAGRILLEGDKVQVINSEVRALVYGSGQGNDIVVLAEDLEVDATTAQNGVSRLTTRVMPEASGAAGDVRVEAARVTLTNGAQLSSIVLGGGSGPGGAVEVQATDSVTINGSNEAGVFSGIATTTLSESNAAGGAIVINSPTASLQIAESGFLQSGSWGAGRSGDIMIHVHDLEVADRAEINSRTFGSGSAGAISIEAVGAVTIITSALFADTEGLSDAGSITISANVIELQRGELNVNTSNTGEAGEIRLEARDSVLLANNSEIQAFSGSPSTESQLGNAGSVSINTGSLSMADSSIDVLSNNLANAGTIEVIADNIHVDNTTNESGIAFNASNFDRASLAPGSELIVAEEARSGTIALTASEIVFDHDADISIQTDAGDGGFVIIRADELSLLNGSNVFAITTGPGRGGDVQVDVTGTFLIEGGNPENVVSSGGINTSPLALNQLEAGPAGTISISAEALIVGRDARIQSDSFSNTPAGAITLNVGTLEVRDGGEISSSAGTGLGADIIITAQEEVSVRGVDPTKPINNSLIAADAGFLVETSGDGGFIQIESPLLVLEQGGQLRSETGTRGDAGDIEVRVDDLVIQSGGDISTSTFDAGRGGEIRVIAESVFISREGSESLNALAQPTGLFSNTLLDATGDAGAINVTAETTMELRSGALITTSTRSAGNAGTIIVSAGELLIDSGLSERQDSAITSSAGDTATGAVGTIQVTADSLIINRGEISVAANQTLPENRLDSASEGFIHVNADQVHLDQGARITAESTRNVPASTIEINVEDLVMEDNSQITTESNEANGGPIRISGHNNIVVRDSLITTSVQGLTGDGGDINLNANALVLQGGFIRANTAAEGASGGDIFIDTKALVASQGLLEVGGIELSEFQPRTGRNVIQAAAPGGEQGTITITSPELDISGTLVMLSTPFVDIPRLISDPCAAAAGKAASSLIRLGRGGVPTEPEQPAAVSFGGERLDRLLDTETEKSEINAPAGRRNRSNPTPNDCQRGQ